MASPSTLYIIVDAGGLVALRQADAEPQNQRIQQWPAHAARIRSFLGCSLGLPALPTPPSASGALVKSNCTFGEIILHQSSQPHRPIGICLLSLEPTDGPHVHSGGMGILPRSLSLQNASQRTGPRIGERSPGLQPYPLPPTPPSPGNICGSSGHFLLASHTATV